VSDIGILNDPVSLLGAIPGALLWRRRRIAGALLGAAIGFVVWLAGWMVFKDVI
jgi:Na+/proline symporter